MFTGFKKKFIGDRKFYKKVLLMVIPMILQNLVTNFVSMIDNIMVGQMGTEQMNGVSIVNQYIFVFNVTIFGAVSGPSIFGAQFFGKKDHEGQKQTFRFRLIVCTLIITAGSLIFGLFGRQLIDLFISPDESLSKEQALISAEQTMKYGSSYLKIMIAGLLPFGIGQAYSSVVRECGETKIPMIGALSAVGVNLLLDYGLIFGNLGMPKMGVRGAAAATVISKFIEASVIIIYVHIHKDRNKYVKGVYRSFYIPKKLVIDMIKRGTPLLINEFLWAAGMSVIAQCYSVRGLDVIAARNISGTMTNLFGAVYIQLGACIAIIVGAKLGANKLGEARDLDNKLLFFSVSATCLLSLIIVPLSPLFPMLYNTTDIIRKLSAFMIIIQAAAMPMWSYTNACYFTLRSGGKTGITFLFDFCYTWLFMIPLAFLLAYKTKMDIHPLYTVITLSEAVKVVIGYFMVRSDIWINNIVDNIDN